MKKIFTLTMLVLFAFALGANAQSRKTWDFTKGFSGTTIANLEADATNWTASEGSGRKWAESKARTANSEIICKVNGQDWTVPETAGLIFAAKSAAHLNVVYDAGTNDDTHIWLNGAKAEDAVTIPGVPAGEKLTVVFSSHGGNAERGFKVSTAGVAAADGKTTFGSSGQMTVELFNNNAEAVDVKLTANVGGMHFYKFIIGEGDVVTVSKVAYLYNGTEDNILSILKANEELEVTPINVTAETITAESLQQYVLTIISPNLPADNAAVTVVKETLPWTPFLNFNASLYPAWGYGEAVTLELPLGFVKNAKSALLKDVEVEESDGTKYITLSETDNSFSGIKLGDYFAGDETALMDLEGQYAVIHSHNTSHNGYVYIPGAPTLTGAAQQIISNAIAMLINSKAEISAATAPKLALQYKDQNTNIVITAPNLPKAEVFYTIDGSTPTVESTKYTEPINVTTETTVKAVAIAEGYTLSSVSEIVADIKSQPKTPIISYEQGDAQTTIKIACESADAKIWYNFEGVVDTLKSTAYADTIPVIITMPQNVTAFAVAGGVVFSEPATQRVLVKNPRVVIDVAGHYSAPQWTADNNPAGLAVANGKGMFSWGASAKTMYIGEGTKGNDPETGDEIIIYAPEDIREPEVVNEPGDSPQWKLVSQGTCMIWQNTGAQKTNFGDDSNYNPMYSTDVDPLFPITSYDIQFYKFQAGEPGNGSIESINKYQAPLDVVVLANMAGGPLLAQVSADGTTWTTIGEIEKTGKARMWSKYTLSYNGTDEVYVRITEEEASAGPKVFDIYIANQGEQSLALLEQLNEELTGIADVKTATRAAAGIYSINGIRQNSLKAGLNIVVEADGSVKKIIRK
ncbi:MAG: chitobiase/beta-hexosaminidase C-terminal domain-containing protein [Prevotella sp.]|nr:chitobiase/beta-hexosaminidase C-terminal domain-containing protein [Prevotella sp.]